MTKRALPEGDREEGDRGAQGGELGPDELFAVRPEEFVAARNALVKRLKAAGERDRAAQVAAWRRPSVVDWALNVVALEEPDVIDRFLDAAAAGRAAQAAAVEGRGEGEDLRAAVSALRDAVGPVSRRAKDVVSRSGKAPSALTAEVTSRLAEISANSDLAAQLERHQLGSGGVDTDDAFGGAGDGADVVVDRGRRKAAGHRAPKAPPVSGRRAPERPPGRASTPTRPSEADKEERRELTQALTAARRAQASARAAADRAARRVQRAEAELARAREQVAAAELAASSEQEEQARLAELADHASRAVDEARTRLDDFVERTF